MNNTQLSALRRIIHREIVSYRPRSRQPAPGQHHSGYEFVVTDGRILVLLHAPSTSLPFGKRADSLIQILINEREHGTHSPVPKSQINLSRWKIQAQQGNDSSYVEMSATDSAGQAITGRFEPQLLVDAVEAVGGESQLLLGMGQYSSHYPSLLIFPPNWPEQGGSEPIVLILPIKK